MTLNDIYQRKAPFLRRNWLQGITNWQSSAGAMGNILSGQLGDGQTAAPPRKRRRVSTPESLDLDHHIASPKTSDTRSMLRIDVLRLCHKDSRKVRASSSHTAPRHVTTTKANCRITFSDTTGGKPCVLHCQNQICDLTTFKNPVGPHRITRAHLAQPFFIPREAMVVRRVDDGTFDLSDAYELRIEFGAATDDGIWPPLDVSDFGPSAVLQDASPNDMGRFVLGSRFQDIFGKLKEPLVLSVCYQSEEPCSSTEYIMDVDLRWSSGFRAWRRVDKDSMPCMTAIDPFADTDDENVPYVCDDDAAVTNNISGHNAVHHHLRSDDEQTEGERTPSRSLRRREQNKVYNLKALSDQARGKERKRRLDTGTVAVEGQVTYLLPSDQPVLLDCNRCVTCGSCHESLLQLQMHLQTYHPSHDYQCENTNQGPQFRVHHRRSDAFLSPSKHFQVKPTTQPFSLQTFVDGDASWITKRVIARANEDLLKTPSSRSAMDRMTSHSPVPRQPVFPGAKTTLPQRLQQPKKDTVVIPNISQPLYHPISKAELKPGDPVPSPEHDAAWLIQKHHESIADFSDVTPQEKEFIWEWDSHVLKQCITSSAYFPRAWLEFVQQKDAWLVAEDEHMREFGKHLCLLVGREELTDDTVKQALVRIRKARSLRTMDVANATLPAEGGEEAAAPSKATDVRKSSKGCAVCQLPVRGPRVLVCTNKICPKRLFHSDCVEATAVVDIADRRWICNSCTFSTTKIASPIPH